MQIREQNPLGPLTRAAQSVIPLIGNTIKQPARDPAAATMQYRKSGPTAPLTAGGNPLSAMMQEPVISGFAGGGEIKETPEQLMARIAAKYGTGTPAQPVAQPAPAAPVAQAPVAQNPGVGQGIFNVLRGRKEQIDKAAGYAGGGKIKGPGTPTSDSIPAQVQQTGEPIKVSTEERIVSKAQDNLLQLVAKGIGFKDLDSMLESGTGKPVGPTVKGGTMAAENGLSPVNNDIRRVNAPGQSPIFTNLPGNSPAVAVNPIAPAPGATLPASLDQLPLQDRQGAHVIGNNLAEFSDKGDGIVQQKDQKGRTTLTNVGTAGVTDPNKAGSPLNSINTAANNESLARANAIRQSMLDSQAAPRYDRGADSGGIKDSGREESQALMDKWAREDQVKQLAANPKAANPMAHLMAAQRQGDITARGQNMQVATAQANDATHRRGQDITAQTYANNLAGNPLDNLLKQSRVDAEKIGIAKTTQHLENIAKLNAEPDPDKRKSMLENILAAQGKSLARQTESLTLPQHRSNAEIDAARKAVEGLSPQEIQRRTAKTTNTGRENAACDQTLERAVNLSNRRKVGADDWFDQRQQQEEKQPQGTDGDAITRFKADQAMKGHRLGKQTENGTEVFDSAGKLVGHYQ